MSRLTILFIKSSLIYFAIAVLVGLDITFMPGHLGSMMPVHAHLMLLGWITMMIYGVAYHILPRFSASPLYSDKIANVQFYVAHIGLIGMAVSFAMRSYVDAGGMLLIVFSIIEAISIILFVFNMLMTLPKAPK
ncbi:MAG: cbb3-type cytochrome c oxidase subunit I [Deltaproteobacteria bacterium]|nr:cbb3-type cytochrome c oxidase subunit I [Deltaproteobacteria bacterium]